MKLTPEIIHSAATAGCGFCAKQMQLFGLTTTPKAGWIERLSGKEISDELWQEILSLKGSKSRERKQARKLESFNGDDVLLALDNL